MEIMKTTIVMNIVAIVSIIKVGKIMTYQQAACDHHVAEVLAGHQGEGALLLELPEHQDQLRDGSCCVGIWDKRLKRMQPESLLSNKRKIVMNRKHLNIMATLLCSAVATKRRMVASKNYRDSER